MPGMQFTRHPCAISTAADDAIGRSKARFGRIDRSHLVSIDSGVVGVIAE
jgi:hypothetical protein